ANDAVGFVEFHIEQGPVLEAENLSVAAVSGIVGQTRLDLRFRGHANHAGTTPMHLRHDALAAGAGGIARGGEVAKGIGGLVATVGKVQVQPNAVNVIPGSVETSLDIRHIHDRVRRTAVDELLEAAEGIADRRGLSFESTLKMDQASVPMDERLTAFLT